MSDRQPRISNNNVFYTCSIIKALPVDIVETIEAVHCIEPTLVSISQSIHIRRDRECAVFFLACFIAGLRQSP